MELLGQLLIKKSLITSDQLEEALNYQKQIGGRMGKVLQKLGYLDEEVFAKFMAEEYAHPYLSFEEIQIEFPLVKQFPKEEMKKRHFFPLHRTKQHLQVAMCDPTDMETTDWLNMEHKRDIEVKIVSTRTVERLLRGFEQRMNSEKAAKPVVKEAPTDPHDKVLEALDRYPKAELINALLLTLIDKKWITLDELLKQLKS